MLAAAAWWFASPWWTLREMREAAEARDAARLSAYVDYAAVRQDLKGEIRRMVAGQMGQSTKDPMQAFGSQLVLSIADPMIDAMITPADVQAMFARTPPLGESAPAAAASKAPVQASDEPVIERQGANRFRVSDKDRTKGAMIFERRGLHWKLVAIDLPQAR